MSSPSRLGTVLVVEDNPITRKMLRLSLETAGYPVIEVGDGSAALQRLEGGDPPVDLVLQDLMLPDMDGFELISRIRKLPRSVETPVLALTGFLASNEEARVVAAGFDGLIVKPIEPSRLLEVIRPFMPPAANALLEPAARAPRILVVDDDRVQRRLARAILVDKGFDVDIASGGVEALARARSRRPDLILSDVLMPMMDGFQLCAAVRGDAALGSIPVVLLTNHYVEQEDRALALRAGAQDLVLRTPGLDSATAAVERTLAAERPSAGEAMGATFDATGPEYFDRVVAQLERQHMLNAGLAQRASILTASLSVLSTIARMLAERADTEQAMHDVIAHCVDAVGLSRGAVLIASPDRWRCVGHVGFGGPDGSSMYTLLESLGHLFDAAARAGRPLVMPGDTDAVDGAALLLDRMGGASAILAPFGGEDVPHGVLLLTSTDRELSSDEWRHLADAISNQLGQALALGTAVAELEASEQKYRLLVENVRDYAILLLDAEGRIASWNQSAQRLYGYDEAEALGLAFGVFFTEQDRARDRPAELLRSAERDGSVEDEGWRVRKDGARFWALVAHTAIRDVQDNLTGFAKVTRDFTSRHRAEELFRKAVEASPHGMVMVDGAGRIRLCNALFAQMLGWFTDELTGMSIEEVLPERVRSVHREHRARFAQNPLARVMGKGRDLFALRRDGTEIPVEVGLNPIEIDDTSYTLASVIDITDRKRIEQALADREARLRALMDHANDGIAILRPDGTILETNQRMCDLVGRPREALVGHAFDEFTAPGAPRLDLDHSPGTGGRAQHHVQRVTLRQPDGRAIIVEFSTGAVRLGEDDLILAIGRDITTQEQMENQLRQSQKMEAVGRLAGGIAHDFNNLLTVISGNAEQLRDELPGAHEMQELIGEIHRAGDRAAALTRQLLAFSRQQMLSPRDVDLVELVRGTERMLSRVIGEDVEVLTRYPAGPAVVHADPGQIEQVILNLAVNARDAMPDGGILTIEVERVELDEAYFTRKVIVQPGSYIVIAVHDTGTGIVETLQDRVFEPFFTTKEVGKGTGLGLATVYGIVKQSGGYIWLYSEPGHGSTFRVYLPAVIRQTHRTIAAAEPARGGNELILLVEDDDLVRSVARRALEYRGYTIMEAANPDVAIELSGRHEGRIDLLLTDVIMPGMSGRALAERLVPLRPDMKVLYSSGYTDEAIVRHGVLEEGIAFLQKPYTPEALARKVREVLDSASQ